MNVKSSHTSLLLRHDRTRSHLNVASKIQRRGDSLMLNNLHSRTDKIKFQRKNHGDANGRLIANLITH